MRVKRAATGDVLLPGTVYVAVQNHHLLVQPSTFLPSTYFGPVQPFGDRKMIMGYSGV
ncbi:chemotaxis protein CheB [Aetokthonos hydrillicola Thurmond2011]|uniref:Chemotaxis protein CheB n=1 Tax=Aetokthonos hydrillicola Thurmond2011 TaxID=2712845 RepID=A0AAP5IBY4_9CYAN|nr:chemotaxis protein CheB [Aetokthonos hydrillicola]MDR9898606.1 chemotaxis protein CheB [Aetokthonos hydrillicola Thurmond2011]